MSRTCSQKESTSSDSSGVEPKRENWSAGEQLQEKAERSGVERSGAGKSRARMDREAGRGREPGNRGRRLHGGGAVNEARAWVAR